MTVIKTLLTDHTELLGTEIEIAGWVRTKRDSKAGFSFVEINDGSHFDSIQVIADQNLTNYTDEILTLTTG